MTDLGWIKPTTVVVERLFSKCRHVLSYERKRLLPRSFEAIIFLKENETYWSSKLVQEMVAGLWDARLGTTYYSNSDSNSDIDD